MDINRRSFLKAAGAAAIGAVGAGSLLKPTPAKASNALQLLEYEVLVPEIFKTQPTAPATIDALVIGTGFGAAATALRLGQAGIKTAMLERGSYWPHGLNRDIFTVDWLPDGRGFWHRTAATALTGFSYTFDNFGGIFDITSFSGIDVWRAAIVGGGSQVYTGVWVQPPQQYFNEIFANTGVSYADMVANWYPKSMATMSYNGVTGVSTMPSDIYASGPWTHARQWDSAAAKMGFTGQSLGSQIGPNYGLLNGNWNWNTVRQELAGTASPSVIEGLSNLGNSDGVKFDLTQNYLPAAVATGNVAIYAGHQVLEIIANSDGTYTVTYNKIDPNGNVLVKGGSVKTNYLFVCAGSIGTTELLLKSEALGGLSKGIPNLGAGWGDNGDSADVATFATTPIVRQGAASHSYLLDTTTNPDMPVRLENWYVPGLPISATILGCLGMAYDRHTRGTFTYNKANDPLYNGSGLSGSGMSLNWGGNGAVTTATRAVHNKMVAAGGGIPGAQPFNTDIISNFTAHPLGGVVLNQSTDSYGRVTGYKNLYVNDAALIPGTTGTANPVWTIIALAERNIANILANDKLK